jgi:hypothetical protein
MMDYSFNNIIKQVNLIGSSHLRDEIKLRRSGELIYQGSVSLLSQAEAALEIAGQKDLDLIDTPIDNSFGQFLISLTQQSVSTSFLQKYLKPQIRAQYERETSVRIQAFTSTEAADLFDLDLFKSEVASLATVKPTHDEDINAWVNLVTNCLKTKTEISTLSQIAKATNLSIAQVFISLLFGDFKLLQSGDFYEGFLWGRQAS